MIENLQSKIGNTPLVRITKYEEKNKIDNQVFVKIEKYNPSGSVKDRASFYMVKDAFEKGDLDGASKLIITLEDDMESLKEKYKEYERNILD